MDKTQHKLAMEFFRGEIKTLAKRISHNKNALRLNQRITSKGLDEPLSEYDASGTAYKYYVPESLILTDKINITAFHIVYGELRGKAHLPEEKKKEYDSICENVRKRMEKYIEEKSPVATEGVASAGGI
jgi:hypothetical protein